MKKRLSIILLSVIAISFTACGGGGGDASFKQETVEISVSCLTTSPVVPTANNIATYQELFSGDSIVKDTNPAVVQIYTPVGANSRVCIESGVAHILRK